MKRWLRKFGNWFSALNPRERWLISVTGVVGLYFLVLIPTDALRTFVDDNARLTQTRTQQREMIATLVRRYKELDTRLKRIKDSFSESQMTFEQVTTELDRIVKASIGSSNYEQKKLQSPQPLDEMFEKQDFTLIIRQATLEQLVKLLHEIEQGKSPLFIGKVDILPGAVDGNFSATIEVASVGKRRDGGGPAES